MTTGTETDKEFVDRISEELSNKIARFCTVVVFACLTLMACFVGVSTESRRDQAELDAPFIVSAADLARLQTLKGYIVLRQDNILSYVCSQSGWNTSGSRR